MTLLILLILSREGATTIETYICYGKEKTYNCILYSGADPNVYDYSKRDYQSVGSVHEFSDAGTGNPFVPADESLESVTEVSGPSSVFIPFEPIFLFNWSRGAK
jgi:hypothetical protein